MNPPSIEDRIADVFDCARAYVAARVEAEGAEPVTWTEYTSTVDRAWHDLRVACGFGCDCDKGTCPLAEPAVHRCPPEDSGEMPCCGRTPFEVPHERLTLDDALVTCEGSTSGDIGGDR